MPSFQGNRHNGHLSVFCWHMRSHALHRSEIRCLWTRHGEVIRRSVRKDVLTADDTDGCLLMLTDAMKWIGNLMPSRPRIYVNDRTVERGLNVFYRNWERRGWRTAGGAPVVHADGYKRAHGLVAQTGSTIIEAKGCRDWPEYIEMSRCAAGLAVPGAEGVPAPPGIPLMPSNPVQQDL